MSERAAAARLAAIVLVLVGVGNVAFGVLALATALVRLTPPVAGTMIVLGLATAALGLLVGRGVRWATLAALVLFGTLFVVQAARAGIGDDPGSTIPSLITLTVVVVPLLVVQRGR